MPSIPFWCVWLIRRRAAGPLSKRISRPRLVFVKVSSCAPLLPEEVSPLPETLQGSRGVYEIPQNSLVLPIDSDGAELPDVILMSVILFEAAVLKLFPVVPCTILSSAPPA